MARPRRRPAWTPLAWMEQSACAGHDDPDLWFPDHDQEDRQQEALRVCTACPVRAACLAYVMAMPPQPGIWGGTTEDQRNRPRCRRASSRARRAS
jgi:WhiB family redox-sensing transcriptional regulator